MSKIYWREYGDDGGDREREREVNEQWALPTATYFRNSESIEDAFNDPAVPVSPTTPFPVHDYTPTQPASDKASFSQTRPNNATGYTANDIVGIATTPNGATAGPAVMTFTFAKLATVLAQGGEFLITSAELERDVAAVISGETTYNLYLYDKVPASANVDNDAFDIPAGDRVNLIGKVALGAPVDEGSTLYIRTDGINQQVRLQSNTVYAYLVTVGAYTPVANTVLKVTLHGIAL